MKVVHIESGLGNQMLSFCEYLALRKLHPDEDIYIENIVYDIPQCNEVIKQWNGYELERIFGIKAPNIQTLFPDEQWKGIMTDIQASEFWNKNWNYPVYITNALNNAGLNLRNIRGDFELKTATKNINMKNKPRLSARERILDTSLGDWLWRISRVVRKNDIIKKSCHYNDVFYQGEDNIFTGQWLSLKKKDSGMEQIEQDVRNIFRFPPFQDKQNIEMVNFLDTCNSIAIHARRGDMLSCNGHCYKFGYFKRAINYIRKRVEKPVFVFFCDPGSIQWCQDNSAIFGLDFQQDHILFVDWNKGTESFRDMQLMAHCKHNIITNSSFGWWGSWLNTNPHKITISPVSEIATNTTTHC